MKNTTNPRTAALKSLMRKNKLTARQVGDMIGREPHTVRCWRCESAGRVIPVHTLELLQLKLQAAAA